MGGCGGAQVRMEAAALRLKYRGKRQDTGPKTGISLEMESGWGFSMSKLMTRRWAVGGVESDGPGAGCWVSRLRLYAEGRED